VGPEGSPVIFRLAWARKGRNLDRRTGAWNGGMRRTAWIHSRRVGKGGKNQEGARNEMNEEQNGQLTAFLAGLLLGSAIGAAAAVLTAPQSGRKTRKSLGKAAVGTRKRIGRTAGDIRKNTGDRWDDFADDLKGRMDDAISGARKKLSNG